MSSTRHRVRKKQLRVLSSTGNLGDTIIEKGTFYKGLERDLDFLAADAGTADCGPAFLGADCAHNPVEWERHDLELLLLAAREKDIPLIIGSCSTTGSRRGVDLYQALVMEIAEAHGLKPFRLATIYSDIDKQDLLSRIQKGPIEPLGADKALSAADIEASNHITAMMGSEPLIHALDQGADVILAGRCCDDAVYAAYPIFLGFPRGLALHLGKAIECASLVCWPQRVKESVVGTINHDWFSLEPIHPEQRATTHSVAAHSMYERVDPYVQGVPGGTLDMHETVYEQSTDRICVVSGSRYIPSADGSYKVKLEGAGEVGYRVFHFVAIRDPLAISWIDKILEDTRNKVAEILHPRKEPGDYELHLHVYGKNGVMRDLEPDAANMGHELGIMIEAIASSADIAETVVKCAKFRFFYLAYPGQKNASGGSAAIVVDEPLFPRNKAYRWTINHLLQLSDPLEIHKVNMFDVGV